MDEQQVIPYQPGDNNEIDLFSGKSPAVISTFADPAESAAALMEAVPLADHVGETFRLKNIVAHKVLLTTEDGDLPAKRLVLVSDDGVAYACVSRGVYNALQIIFGLYGVPPTNGFDPAIPVKIQSLKAKVGKVLTLVVQSESKRKAKK